MSEPVSGPEQQHTSWIIESFSFLEPPDERAVADGWQQLVELGAVDSQHALTAIGREMARLPVDVKLARMLVAARQHGCVYEMTVIAAFLGSRIHASVLRMRVKRPTMRMRSLPMHVRSSLVSCVYGRLTARSVGI